MKIEIGYLFDDFLQNRLTVLLDGIFVSKIYLNQPESLKNVSPELYLRLRISQIIKAFKQDLLS